MTSVRTRQSARARLSRWWLGLLLALLPVALVACARQPAPPASEVSLGVAESPSGSFDSTAGWRSVTVPVDATGRSDVTARLNSFLAGVPPQTRVVFKQGGRYRADGTLTLAHRSDLVLDGRGSTIFAAVEGSATRVQWLLSNVRHVTMRNLTVVGTNKAGGSGQSYVPRLEHQHSLSIRGGGDIEVDHVNLERPYGDCIYVASYGGVWANGVHIHSSRCEANGRMGVALVGASNVVVEQNVFADISLITLDIEPSRGDPVQGAHGVRFSNNRVLGRSSTYFFGANGWGVADDVVVSNNHLPQQPLWITVEPLPGSGFRRSHFVIRDNVSGGAFHNPGGAAMAFTSVDGLLVTGNRQPLRDTPWLVAVRDSCQSVVTGNSIPRTADQVHVLSPCPRASR